MGEGWQGRIQGGHLMPTEPFLTCGAIARALGIGRETVRQLTLSGVLTAYKPAGRRLYLESEAREAIKGQPHVPAEDRYAAGVAAARKVIKQQQQSALSV